MILRNGVDLVDIGRFEGVVSQHGDRFLDRVFTPQEREEAGENMASLAARFAAKEAVSKALGTGIGDVRWREIEVLRGPNREPHLHLHGAARTLAEVLSLQTWTLSLSHTHHHAIAMVVALGDDPGDES